MNTTVAEKTERQADALHRNGRTQGVARESGQGRRREARLLVRRQPGAQEHQPGDPGKPGDGADRPVGLRQEHVPALLQPHARPAGGHPLRGQHHAAPGEREPRRQGSRSDRGPHADRHGVPEAEPVSEDGVRERGLRPAPAWLQQPHGAGRARREGPARRGDLGRGQGSADGLGAGALGRPDAAPVHRARARDGARNPVCSTSRPRRSIRSRRQRSKS